jgi:hypothetical protein
MHRALGPIPPQRRKEGKEEEKEELPGGVVLVYKLGLEAEGVAQAVQHLLCKCEALSSKPSPTKQQ